jgi:uncharacterized membrane protein SpoIIM required for sporulation
MVSPRFYHIVWLAFIAGYFEVGVTAALIAGALFALGSVATALAAVVVAAACGVLCGMASASRRELPRMR